MSDDQAKKYGPELAKLAGRNSGHFTDTFTPEQVVEAAEPKTSPLHDWFEWNDSEAAHEYRLVQAREMLRFIEVIIEERPAVPIRMFEVVRIDNEKVYARVDRVFTQTDLAQQVIDNALMQLRGWRERYSTYIELAEICGAIDAELAKREIAKSKEAEA